MTKTYGHSDFTFIIIIFISQGPKVSDEKLREVCSAVVEGSVYLPSLDLHPHRLYMKPLL